MSSSSPSARRDRKRWIDRNQAALGIPVQMGVGGVLNFFAGQSLRAPVWCAAWSWSGPIASRPSRGAPRRQLALPHFALLAAVEAVRQRRRARPVVSKD